MLCGLILQCLIVSQNAMASLFDPRDLPLFDILSICVLAALVLLVQFVFLLASLIKVNFEVACCDSANLGRTVDMKLFLHSVSMQFSCTAVYSLNQFHAGVPIMRYMLIVLP